jgi:hypothetical protein
MKLLHKLILLLITSKSPLNSVSCVTPATVLVQSDTSTPISVGGTTFTATKASYDWGLLIS